MTASDSRRHERRIGLLTLTTLAIAVMLAPAQAAAQSVADEKGGGGLRPSEPLRYSDPILLKEAPIDLLVRELEARRAAATPIVLPAPEQPGYGDKGSGKDGGGNGSPPEDGMRSPPPGCACANLTLTIDPGEEVGPFCVPVALDMERLPWCREPGAGELADGADPCTAADDKPILCSLAPMDPGVTHAAAGGDNLLAGFGYGIEGTVSGDVRQCIEGQVVQRSATMLYRLASDPDSIRQIHLLGHSVEQPTDLPAIGNRRHFVVNAGDRIAGLGEFVEGENGQIQRGAGDYVPPIGSMGQIADADGNAVPVTIWGADGYDAPERTRKLYSDDNTRMRMYDFPHYPRVELRETVNMGGPFTIVRYLDAFRFLFYLGDVNRGLCSCSGRFFLDYASGDPAEGVAAPDGMRLSFEKDEALSVNCDVVGTLAPIPDLLRSSVYPDESR